MLTQEQVEIIEGGWAIAVLQPWERLGCIATRDARPGEFVDLGPYAARVSDRLRAMPEDARPRDHERGPYDRPAVRAYFDFDECWVWRNQDRRSTEILVSRDGRMLEREIADLDLMSFAGQPDELIVEECRQLSDRLGPRQDIRIDLNGDILASRRESMLALASAETVNIDMIRKEFGLPASSGNHPNSLPPPTDRPTPPVPPWARQRPTRRSRLPRQR